MGSMLDLQCLLRLDLHYLRKRYRKSTLKFKSSKATVLNQPSVEKQTKTT